MIPYAHIDTNLRAEAVHMLAHTYTWYAALGVRPLYALTFRMRLLSILFGIPIEHAARGRRRLYTPPTRVFTTGRYPLTDKRARSYKTSGGVLAGCLAGLLLPADCCLLTADCCGATEGS